MPVRIPSHGGDRMRHFRLYAALLFAAGLLLFPETALNAAREAMYAWYSSVAPALFPFMVLTPMIACPEAVALYERLLGRVMRLLTGLPGAAAPAVIIAMTAGSPAGALAAVRCGLSRRDTERLLGCVCGLSPAFLLGGIGAGMLGDAALGMNLLKIQLTAQLAMLTLTRFFPSEEQRAEPSAPESAECIRPAVMNILTVGGYMIVFSVAAALIARILRSETAGNAVLCLLDVPTGARAVAAFPLYIEEKMTILAAMTGMGGLCIALQNLSAAKKAGARGRIVLPLRCANGLICAILARSGLFRGGLTTFNLPPIAVISTLIAAFLMIPACFSLGNTLFLNKRNSGKNCLKTARKPKNPQHVVDNVENNGQHLVIQKT